MKAKWPGENKIKGWAKIPRSKCKYYGGVDARDKVEFRLQSFKCVKKKGCFILKVPIHNKDTILIKIHAPKNTEPSTTEYKWKPMHEETDGRTQGKGADISFSVRDPSEGLKSMRTQETRVLQLLEQISRIDILLYPQLIEDIPSQIHTEHRPPSLPKPPPTTKTKESLNLPQSWRVNEISVLTAGLLCMVHGVGTREQCPWGWSHTDLMTTCGKKHSPGVSGTVTENDIPSAFQVNTIFC